MGYAPEAMQLTRFCQASLHARVKKVFGLKLVLLQWVMSDNHSETMVDEVNALLTSVDLSDIPGVAAFSKKMTEQGGEAVLAIIFYGSTLNPGMSKKTSTPDYYVVVSNYKTFYRNLGEVGLAARWPQSNLPSQYLPT